MEEKDIYLIPRNLNKSDVIIHSPIRLNWKEIFYLGLGAGGIVWIYNLSLPTFINITAMVITGIVSVFGAIFKYEGLMIHELIADVIMYFIRKLHYKNDSQTTS